MPWSSRRAHQAQLEPWIKARPLAIICACIRPLPATVCELSIVQPLRERSRGSMLMASQIHCRTCLGHSNEPRLTVQSLTVQGPPLSNRMLALTARMYDICRHSFMRVVGTVLLSAARC